MDFIGFKIHSFASGHLVCFLAIVNSAAVNIGVYMSFRIVVFSGYICLVVGLLGHMEFPRHKIVLCYDFRLVS